MTDTGATSEAAGKYTLRDRAGAESNVDFDAVRSLILQGRLFRSDTVRMPDASEWAIGEVPAFRAVFREVLPEGGEDLPASPDIAGEGDTLALLEVFARLFHMQRTGRLHVRHEELGHERTVVFRGGVPVAAWSNVEDEWIGEVLVSKGYIDEATFQEAVARRQQTGKRIGSALVELDKISQRRLQMALSVQALERLLNIFRAGEGTRFRFVPDETAADEEILLVARPREIIETAIATAMSPSEVKTLLESFGNEAVKVDVSPLVAEELSTDDHAVLEILSSRSLLGRALPAVARAARLTLAEARVRVLALATFGVVQLGDDRIRNLSAQLEQLQSENYFEMLGLRLGAESNEVVAAVAAKRAEFDPGQLGGALGTDRVLGQITAVIDRAERVLATPMSRAIYQRAIQMGVDFEDEEARRHVEFDEYLAQAHVALTTKAYDKARELFSQASKRIPADPRPYVQLGWARFLASGREKRVAATAIKEIRRALELQPDFDVAWLYIGKIQRLIGQLDVAETSLRRAIRLNPRNTEAQSELRLIFTRELTGGRARRKARLGMGGDVGLLVAFAFAAIGGLYIASNHISGGAKVWPDVGQFRADSSGEADMREIGGLVTLRLQNDEETLVATAQDLGATEDVDEKEEALAYLAAFELSDVYETLSRMRKVRPDQQVLGNVEFYYVSKDPFFWLRRGGLLIFGLIGIVALRRRLKMTETIWGSNHAWLGAAIPYGIVVGLLSGVVPAVSPVGVLLAMTFLHVLAEQVFFSGLLGRGLLAKMDSKMTAVAVVAALYGLYQLTFFAVLNQPAPRVMLDVLQIGIFVGGASALLLWRSEGLLAPFVAHLLINTVMILRSALG